MSERIKLNTTLMDKKTRLLDENATLEQRRKKDKVSLDKVSMAIRSLILIIDRIYIL